MTSLSLGIVLSRSQHAPETSPQLGDKRLSVPSPRQFPSMILLEGWEERWTITKSEI